MNTIFDTHCHPYLNKKKDQYEVIDNFFKNGGKYINIIGTNIETSNKAIEIADKYEGVFVSVGIHPCDTYDLDLNDAIVILENLIKNNKNKIVGIGECGLDYYWLDKDEMAVEIKKLKIKTQKKFFKAQIELAKKYNLPLIIHNRDSKDDVFSILKKVGYKNFIFHCYSENLEYAEKLLKFSPNCKISFSGIVTFKNAKEIQETAKNIPIKNILAETDSPYLTPTPFRGKEENEPLFTKYIVKKISELRGEQCDNIILKNSLEIFGIKK
ncbi:MAG: TatD family hydrolase [Candidatus Gracilibacteria bacterium]